jgi:hypothetical protein
MPWIDDGARLVRTYCECDLPSMHDFLGEDTEEVQDARQCCWICAEGADDIFEDVLPLGHLYCQVRQTHAQLQPDGLRSGVEQGQIAHDRGPEIWKLCAGHLVEVVYDLALLAENYCRLPVTHLALEGGGSEKLGCCICRVRLQHSQCGCPCLLLQPHVSPHIHRVRPSSTYRLLELLQKLMCLLLLRAVRL